MQIDLLTERVLSLKEATKFLPPIDGKRPHISTIWRWCRKGLHGVHLEYARFGSRIVTSAEALTRFANALAAADTDLTPNARPSVPLIKSTDKSRAASIQRAKSVLAHGPLRACINR